MEFEERQYQTDTVDAWWQDVESSADVHPIVSVPTGGGKTVIMAKLIERYLEKYPDNKIVILSHTQEILRQDYDALIQVLPYHDIGIMSAGLGHYELRQITIAGIQTAYNRIDQFKWTNLFIVDECHTVNHKANGMYRKLFDEVPGTIAGMSATVFRSGHGYIHHGGGVFNRLSHDLTSVDNFNKLVNDGYLTKLTSVSPEMEMDVENLKQTAGDYQIKHMGERFDRHAITNKAVTELVKYGQHNYKKWLVFAIDIDHCDNICKELINQGIDARVLHSKMEFDRDKTIDRFKTGDTRALVSVGMVTTGFDAPNIDLIALLRPTKSALLHVQMVGRGLRVAPGKSHCLVLDFAGNTERLGPINDVRIPKKTKKGNKLLRPIMKRCPACRSLHPPAVRICDICGHEFHFEVNINVRASTTAIVKGPVEKKWLNVTHVQYTLHKKFGKPDSMLVVYHCGLTKVKEWVCLEHGGFAGRKAHHWAGRRGYDGALNTHSLVENCSTLKKPKQILVEFIGKYPKMTNSTFEG